MDGSKKAYAPNKTSFRGREERNISAERLITPPPKYTEHAPLLNKSRSKMDERAKKGANAPPGAKWVVEEEKDNEQEEARKAAEEQQKREAEEAERREQERRQEEQRQQELEAERQRAEKEREL